MWAIYEHRSVAKQLSSAADDVLKKYEKWKDIAALSGPQGLCKLKGLHDEKWKGYRSSRLNVQYRVIYKVEKEQLYIQVEKVTPHDYRRK